MITAVLMLVSMGTLPSITYAQSNKNQQIADEVINLVKAQWATEIAAPDNVTEQYKNVADDYTEFNPDFSTLLEGKDLVVRLTEAFSKDPGRSVAAEMLNPKVQVYGDVVILSYNFAGIVKNKAGEMKPTRAKSTRVYAKQDGKWKLVHANFASDPMPKD